MAQVECRHFNGYKPCDQVDSLKVSCDANCPAFARNSAGPSILLIHLGALGAVARSTALVPAIHRKYPDASLTWLTDRPADQVLLGVPGVDRILTTDLKDLTKLRALEFDVALVVDKSLEAEGLLASLKKMPAQVFGFRADSRSGAIRPATAAAEELWQIGLSNKIKFHINRKTENQLVHEALELGEYLCEEYQLRLSQAERESARRRHLEWSDQGARPVLGLNTGCADTIRAKKLTVEGHVGLIKEIAKMCNARFVLLGGREDGIRNSEIARLAREAGCEVVESPTSSGIRDGMISVAACDAVVSGDSFGLHLAIGLKRPVVAWFGPTCSHEIEIYGRGYKVETLAGCSPCWKRQCSMNPMCYDLVDFRDMARKAAALFEGLPRSTERLRLEVSPDL